MISQEQIKTGADSALSTTTNDASEAARNELLANPKEWISILKKDFHDIDTKGDNFLTVDKLQEFEKRPDIDVKSREAAELLGNDISADRDTDFLGFMNPKDLQSEAVKKLWLQNFGKFGVISKIDPVTQKPYEESVPNGAITEKELDALDYVISLKQPEQDLAQVKSAELKDGLSQAGIGLAKAVPALALDYKIAEWGGAVGGEPGLVIGSLIGAAVPLAASGPDMISSFDDITHKSSYDYLQTVYGLRKVLADWNFSLQS